MILKRFLVMLVAVTFLSGFGMLSAAKKENLIKPKVKKGAEIQIMTGTLRHWKDTKKLSLKDLNQLKRKRKPILNLQNPRKIKRKFSTPDPVVQKAAGLGRESKAMSAPIIDFAGMNLNAHGAGSPPDTVGDVGPTYFVQAVNTSIGIYNKSTGALVSATTFNSFFGGPAPCTNNNQGDPIVLYDQYEQRWFILDFAWTSTNGPFYYSIAASQTSDPTGAWWQYCLQADATLLNDYPKCGIWHDGIYTTANMFVYSTSQFQHVKVWAFKKPDIYNGTLTVQSLIDNSYQAWSLLPSNAKSATPPSSSDPNYMYALDADEYGPPSIDAIYYWKYAVDWNTPANTTWTGPVAMPTAPFGLTASGIPQPGTGVQLDSLFGRLMNPAQYRKFTTHEAVYLCHVAESAGKRVMRWYEIRIAAGASSIYQQSTYDPDSEHRWMGSIGGDKNGNIAMGYSISSSSVFPGVRYSGRLAGDPLNQLAQGEAVMENGGGSQTGNTRWGDYSAITIDPDDDETFWYTQEYYTTNGSNWQTRIGSFKMVAPPQDPIAVALDYPSLTFTTGGAGNWYVFNNYSYFGGSSIRSPAVGHSTKSFVSTTISGFTTIKFWWAVSSELNGDYIFFLVDGQRVAGTSGFNLGWTQQTITVTPGTHTISWYWYKNGSVSAGRDTGLVDRLELQ
ncbi:MAG: hypothetical protein GY940_01475 [bacterium]|nr:hypothetical protein [bacterium]